MAGHPPFCTDDEDIDSSPEDEEEDALKVRLRLMSYMFFGF